MKYLKIRLTFKHEKNPYLLDISSLFYDFELLHDFCLILYVDDYEYYKFGPYFWYRKGRPIKNKHRLRVFKIVKESPLTIELITGIIVALSGALWAIVQAIEKISNWKLNREKLKKEIERLEKEIEIKFYEAQKAKIEFEQKLLERNAWKIFYLILRRLEANSIVLDNLEISAYSEQQGEFDDVEDKKDSI